MSVTDASVESGKTTATSRLRLLCPALLEDCVRHRRPNPHLVTYSVSRHLVREIANRHHYLVMDFDRINYDAGVMFVFSGKNNSRLYTIGIHPKREECCSRHRDQLSRLQASAQRKYDAGLLLGYYTPDGSVHTFDDGDEDSMFDRIAKIRQYMFEAVERDISTFREIDEPVKEYEPPTESPSGIYDYPKYKFEP